MSNEIPQPGSTISLISNAQLRYEGTLELIKMGPEESSLSLSHVKSFGTEDRVDPSRHVPPSEDRFEYVVFKGTDIISLDVKDYYRGPPRQSFAPPPVQPPAAPSFQNQQQSAVWGPPSVPPQQGNTWGQSPPPPQVTPHQQPAPDYARPAVPPAGQPAPGPAPTVLVTPSMPPRSQAEVRQPAPRQSGWSNTRPAVTVSTQPPPPGKPAVPQAAAQPTESVQPNQPSAPAAARVDNAGPPPGFSGPPPGMQHSRSPRAPVHSGGRMVDRERGRGRGRARAPRGRGRERPSRDQHGNEEPRASPVPIPNEDFNFEEALSRFDKDKLKEEADYGEGLEEVAVVSQAYNKDDFFDALSSGLSDRQAGGERPQRIPFSEQRKLDMETFGGSGRARRPMRGRGGRPRGPGRAPGGPRGRGRGREAAPPVPVS